MDMTFNMIFTPGTVRYLRLSVLSLLEYSPYCFRLIANGLNGEELSMLENFCRSHQRLGFYRYPSVEMALHWDVLTHLEANNTDEYFCFCDNDIFALAPFADELEEELREYDVFSSCKSLWSESRIPHTLKKRTDFSKLITTFKNTPLPKTFFCVYRSSPIRKVIEETGVSFGRYREDDIIPELALSRLKELNLERYRFDTGKLLNVLSFGFGLKYKRRDLDGLKHIGGISRSFIIINSNNSLKKRIRLALEGFGLLKEKRRWPERMKSGLFFAAYMMWLFGDRAKPVWKPSETPLDDTVAKMCDTLNKIYKDYSESLNSESASFQGHQTKL